MHLLVLDVNNSQELQLEDLREVGSVIYGLENCGATNKQNRLDANLIKLTLTEELLI